MLFDIRTGSNVRPTLRQTRTLALSVNAKVAPGVAVIIPHSRSISAPRRLGREFYFGAEMPGKRAL